MIQICVTYITNEMIVDEVLADEVVDVVVQPDAVVTDPVVQSDVVVANPVPYATADTKVTTPSTEPFGHTN